LVVSGDYWGTGLAVADVDESADEPRIICEDCVAVHPA
jgi:hypothetical protein